MKEIVKAVSELIRAVTEYVDLAIYEKQETIRRTYEKEDDRLQWPVERLGFSVRVRRALDRAKVETVGGIVRMSDSQLMSHRDFGETSLNEVREKLGRIGFALRGEEVRMQK